MKALFNKKKHEESAEERFARSSSEWHDAGRPASAGGGGASQQPPSPPSGYNSNSALRSDPHLPDTTTDDPPPQQYQQKKKANFLQRFAHKNPSSSGTHPSGYSPAPSFAVSTTTPPPTTLLGGSRQGSGVGVDRKIGWFCATGNDDWSRVLEMCDSVSRSEAESKEAARALRKEIKYGTPDTQERALRLLAIMMWNTTDRFRLQVATKRFLEVVEEVCRNPRTDLRVRRMLLKAFCALAYDFRHDGDLALITQVYNRIKPPGSRQNGEPLDENDHTFDPTTFGTPSRGRHVPPAPLSPRRGGGGGGGRTGGFRRDHRSAPRWERPPPEAMFDPSDDVRPPRDLMAEAEVARSNAKVLVEALAFTSPSELDGNEVVQEFYAKCLQSQDQLMDDIPWATAQANRSRDIKSSAKPASSSVPAPTTTSTATPADADPAAVPPEKSSGGGEDAGSPPPVPPDSTRPLSSHNPYASLVPSPPTKSVSNPLPLPTPAAPSPPARKPEEQTPEEKLLASLLAAQDALTDAFLQHEEVERLARMEREMEEVRERSKKETRLDRTKAVVGEDGEWMFEQERRGDGGSGAGAGGYLGVGGEGMVASGSRSPSPSPRLGSGSGETASRGREGGQSATAYLLNGATAHSPTEGSATGGVWSGGRVSEEGAYGGINDDEDDVEVTEGVAATGTATGMGMGIGQGRWTTDPEPMLDQEEVTISSNNPFAAAMQASRQPHFSPRQEAAATGAAGGMGGSGGSGGGGAEGGMPRSGTVDSIIPDPVEPSAKALGKMRMYSGAEDGGGGSGADEEGKRREEERLWERYRR